MCVTVLKVLNYSLVFVCVRVCVPDRGADMSDHGVVLLLKLC